MEPTRRNFLKAGAAVSAGGLIAQAPQALAQGTGAPQSMLGKSYAETARPKPWTSPQRPGKPISIDVHSHWSPASYLKAKADLGQPDTLPPINYDMDRRVGWMDQHGV